MSLLNPLNSRWSGETCIKGIGLQHKVEGFPLSKYPHVHFCFTMVLITLLLHLLCHLIALFFLLHCRVSTVIPFVSLLPGESDLGQQMPLSVLVLHWLTHFLGVSYQAFHHQFTSSPGGYMNSIVYRETL